MKAMARASSASVASEPPLGGIAFLPAIADLVRPSRPSAMRGAQAALSPVFGAPATPASWQAPQTPLYSSSPVRLPAAAFGAGSGQYQPWPPAGCGRWPPLRQPWDGCPSPVQAEQQGSARSPGRSNGMRGNSSTWKSPQTEGIELKAVNYSRSPDQPAGMYNGGAEFPGARSSDG